MKKKLQEILMQLLLFRRLDRTFFEIFLVPLQHEKKIYI